MKKYKVKICFLSPFSNVRGSEVAKMILEKIKNFIEQNCPLLAGKRIAVNFLGEIPQSYSMEHVPENPILKKYPDGGSLRQFVFIFASREFYDSNSRNNLDVANFYEAFAQWIDQVNQKGTMPSLGNGRSSLRFEVLSGGFLADSRSGSAKYQIKCRLLYEKEGEF